MSCLARKYLLSNAVIVSKVNVFPHRLNKCHSRLLRPAFYSTDVCLTRIINKTAPNKCKLQIRGVTNQADDGKPKKSILDSITGGLIPDEAERKRMDEETRKSDEKKKKWFKVWVYVTSGMFALSFVGLVSEFGAPKIDDNGEVIEDSYSDLPKIQQYVKRCWNEIWFYEKLIKEPVRSKLLPDPLQAPYFQPPYTLVIELTDVLVHPDWTYSTGWRFKKRPFVKYMLSALTHPKFEIVVYTHENAFMAYPIIDSLDSEGCIMYRLFRDATRYVNGKRLKDLAYLNRDLSKVIIVDCDKEATKLAPRNAIVVPKWKGDDDTMLVDLTEFLKTIADSNVDDVREVLDNYREEGGDMLEQFRKRKEILAEQQKEQEALMAKKGSVPSPTRFGFFLKQ